MNAPSSAPQTAQESCPKVTVVDAVMGSGKTYHAHKIMNQMATFDGQYGPGACRFVFITPFLDEVGRAKEACPGLDLIEPDTSDYGSKAIHFEMLIKAGRNIATTHASFHRLTPSGIEALRSQNYRLIIDEAVETASLSALQKGELQYLLSQEMMEIDGEGRCHWRFNDKGGKLAHRFDDVRDLCNSGSLYLFEETFLIWELPRAVLDAFKEVTILTYLFEASSLAGYLRAEGIPYAVQGIEFPRGGMMPRELVSEATMKAIIRTKLRIYEGPKNGVGSYRPKGSRRGTQKFTQTHLNGISEGTSDCKRIQNAVKNYIQKDVGSCADKTAWTTFKAHREKLSGPSYGAEGCFISINARATNDYDHKEVMVYLANRFPNPALQRYLAKSGAEIEPDIWALSEMLQWLWRGCIRKAARDPECPVMHVYVPSERMRGLLQRWLDADSYGELLAGSSHPSSSSL